jgi:hypothetical protein
MDMLLKDGDFRAAAALVSLLCNLGAARPYTIRFQGSGKAPDYNVTSRLLLFKFDTSRIATVLKVIFCLRRLR